MTLNDLVPQNREFSLIFRNFWMQRTFQESIATKCLKIYMYQDNLHTKFSALNADFSSQSADPIGSKRPAHASVKEGYPSKKC